MCNHPVTYKQIDDDSFVFRTSLDYIKLNLEEVRQVGEWCKQILDHQGDENGPEYYG